MTALTEANIQSSVDAVSGVTWRSAVPAHAAPGDAWAERVTIIEAGRQYWVPAVVVVSSKIAADETYLAAVVGALQATFADNSSIATPDVVSVRHVDPAGSWQAWRIQFTGGELSV